MNDLLLLSGNNIPFTSGQLIIHQPSIKEIAYIGEEIFYTGCQYLNFSKDILSQEDKNRLGNLNDFEVLMTILRNNDITIKKIKGCMQFVLLLIFPEYQINFLPTSIMLSRQIDGKKQNHLIDKDNYNDFKKIIKEIFCLENTFKSINKYNPGGPQAAALVQKFKKRQKRLAELKNKGEKEKISILSRYVSILAVGQKKNMNELLQYTVYQLFDEFRRFKRKEQYDIYVKAKLAGATNLEEIEDWMGTIHSDTL